MMMMMVCVKRWDYANKQKNPLMMIQKTPYHNPKNIFFTTKYKQTWVCKKIITTLYLLLTCLAFFRLLPLAFEKKHLFFFLLSPCKKKLFLIKNMYVHTWNGVFTSKLPQCIFSASICSVGHFPPIHLSKFFRSVRALHTVHTLKLYQIK